MQKAADVEAPVAHPISGWEGAGPGRLAASPIQEVRLLPDRPDLLLVRSGDREHLIDLEGRPVEAETRRLPSQPPLPPPAGIPRREVTDPRGDTWVATDEGLWRRSEGLWVRYRSGDGLAGLPNDDVRDLQIDAEGHLWLATPRGLTLFMPPDGWETLTGQDGLPMEDLTCVALAPDGDRWLGSTQGLIRLTEGRFEYFAGRRWLPHDHVTGLAVGPDGTVFVGTEGGLGRLRFLPLTLEQKAQRFEEVIRLRHSRLGYVASCRLERPGDLDSFIHEATDNDGLWTSLYLAAECFRYAVTGSPESRELAERSADALLQLEAVTGIPGFPARARVEQGERVIKSEGEWHPTVDGRGEWKGDTSSDELVGHYFGLPIYFDLAADEAGRERVRATLGRITDHLLEHGYGLRDVDGQWTRWAVYGPDQLNRDPGWADEKGLNSLELLAHLQAAYHVTGRPRYREAYLELVQRHHYALNTIRQKRDWPYEINHSDDELAFLSYYPLLTYEKDPDLRALYLASLERSWRIEQPEACPLYDVIYAALTGRREILGPCLRTLEEIPLDLVTWTCVNSHRTDLKRDTRFDRFGHAQSKTALSPRERAVTKWNANPYRMDTGNGGLEEDDGTFFLLPYWMWRYHGATERGVS